jgi:hypothetical protein
MGLFMDDIWFDRLTRRLVLGGFACGPLATLLGCDFVTAKKGKGKERLKRNQFGCVDVGGKCRGNDANCCSGICEGKKPKKGKKDKSRCVAHDAGSCVAGQRPEFCGASVGGNLSCTTSIGTPGICHTTTGNAGYCGGKILCTACQRDADCQESCGLLAACLQCDFCGETGGTACSSP